ncbi:aspartate aminotransferase family protein [Ferviditalea candida]|uniref:Aspartate aminotransferase family protein n=1 Tax=Ferviditalea candida TaxID=3108399 RepID=A0ABU5ZIB3_9BACL|nr:aspartate aminotransferase family protein [Paenibacillaceae bacterium T2]
MVLNDQTKSSVNELTEKDKEYLWHFMTPYNPDAKPTIFTEADGSWITDAEGNRYLDGMSGLWCVNVGYGRKELAEAAYEQLQTMPYYPLTQSHIPAIKLAEKLNEWLGGEYKIIFSNSGSEANETAFKLARQYHAQNGQPGRFKFISRYRAYHGNSMGSLAATGQAQRKYKYEPLAPGFVHVSPPDCYRCPFGKSKDSCNLECAEAIDQVINWEWPDTVAGVIMEPVITGGGILVPHDNYLKKVEKSCRKHNVLLIVDEVICGFGRTGKRFGFQHYGVKPDIISMAKGITSGYLPLSATAVRKDMFERFMDQEETSHFRHVNTYGGNPAACSLALRNLQIMEDENLVGRSADLGRRLQQGLNELKEHPNVGDIRGLGFLVAIELVMDKADKTPAAPSILAQVIGECRKRGLIIGKNGDTVKGFNNILTIAPPLSSTDEDLDFIIRTLIESINTLN